MSIDLTKPSPAPWKAVRPRINWRVMSGDRFVMEGKEPRTEADAEFIALARNAFDVMMRRGWSAAPKYMNRPGASWRVRTTHLRDCAVEQMEWADPFTALVEADAWMTAQEANG